MAGLHRGVAPWACLAAVAALSALGCAGYAGSVKEMRTELLAGNKDKALGMANSALDVKEADDEPEDVSGDNALLLVERATIKQGLSRYGSSAVDFQTADKHLELLDLKNDTAGNIGKFLFSDDTTVYKAPAYEKLLLSTLNMLNYLSLGDLENARVEARRLDVMRKYLADEKSEQAAVLGLGGYLAGFAFEMSGRAEQALGFYDQALADGGYASLTEPIRRLAACTSFRTERLRQLVGEGGEAAPACDPNPRSKGTVLVVVGTGLAPHKEAMRIPIGAALVLAGAVTFGPSLGMSDRNKAGELAAKGLLTWINFPVMERTRDRFTYAHVGLDGRPAPVEEGMDVTERVLAAWNSIKGTLMVAAITRMITRAIAAEVVQRGTKAGGAGGALSLLAGLAVEGTMMAADTPDTRSWVTLPSKVFVSRMDVTPGRHIVSVVLEGPGGRQVIEKTVDVKGGGFAVVSVASMR
ncbi:MAG: hypothetical protein PHU25_00900 [Deltaproteobacteria bacterium]|nr:hypothetical protein [Deltaproteobacteria bacterium]